MYKIPERILAQSERRIVMKTKRVAVPAGKGPDGKKVYRFPVTILCNRPASRDLTSRSFEMTIKGRTASEVADYVKERMITRPSTEIFVTGPRGGKTYRYISWEGSIGAQIMYPDGSNTKLPEDPEDAIDLALKVGEC